MAGELGGFVGASQEGVAGHHQLDLDRDRGGGGLAGEAFDEGVRLDLRFGAFITGRFRGFGGVPE